MKRGMRLLAFCGLLGGARFEVMGIAAKPSK